MSRTVTKVIFHDSSDDEADTRAPGTTTTIVDVRQDNLCMNEEDLVDPEEHFLRCDEVVGAEEDDFVEDAMPDLDKAKGTLAINRANTVEVAVMDAPTKREGGMAPRQQRPGKRPETASAAHSTRRRLRDDDDEGPNPETNIVSNTNNEAEEGMTTDEMLQAASEHGLPAPPSAAVDALDALEEEVVKAVLLPNGTNRDPLAVKISTEGYRLSLDEHDVQDVFEDDEDGLGEEEEDEEDDHELHMLMAVSAIEQMIGACERYQPNEEDGGMCPWAEEAAASPEKGADQVNNTTTAATASASCATEKNAPISLESVPLVTAEVKEVAEEAKGELDGPAADERGAAAADVPHDEQQATKRLIHRPRIFDTFVEKGKALLAQLQAKEITADDLLDALEEDVDAVQRAFKRINRPVDSPIYIDGVKMDF